MQTSDLEIKKLSGTSPGELVRLSTGGNAPVYCIVMGQEGPATILACLEPVEAKVDRPFHFAPSKEISAVSFGVDWFLEIEKDDQFYVGSQAMTWGSGALRLQGSELILSIHQLPTDYRHSEIYFNLTTNEMTDPPKVSASAPISRWRIWENREAATVPGATPLVTVSAVDAT